MPCPATAGSWKRGYLRNPNNVSPGTPASVFRAVYGFSRTAALCADQVHGALVFFSALNPAIGQHRLGRDEQASQQFISMSRPCLGSLGQPS